VASENGANNTNNANGTANNNNINDVPQLRQALFRDVARWSHFIKAQQLAIEILTNICSEDVQQGT
jgi:hypothetical protein